MGNVLTEAMLRAQKLMVNVDKRFGEIGGAMPYGKRKATPAESREQKARAEEAEMQELLNG